MPAFGPPRQIGFLSRNIDESMAFYTDHFGVGPWFVMDQIALTNTAYLGAPCGITLSAALAAWGSMQIEIVQQHDDQPSIYRDWYSRDFARDIQHHVAFWVDDFDEALQRADRRGFRVAQLGRLTRGAFAYLAHPGNPDQILELTEQSAARRATNAAIAEAARDWSGEQPRRAFSDL